KNTGQRHKVCDRGSIAEVVKDNIKYHDPDRCYEIGHRASDCKNKRVCGNCGDEEHSFKECRARIKCCVLCERENEFNKNSDAIKTNHDSRASECPTIKGKPKRGKITRSVRTRPPRQGYLLPGPRDQPNPTTRTRVPATKGKIHMSQVAGPSTAKQPGCPARETRGKPTERPTQPDDPTTRAEVPANEADRPTQPDDPDKERQVSVCFIQEPHTRQGKIIGLGSPLKTFYRPGGNPRTAICTQGQEGTVLLLEDISTETMTIAEITVQGLRIYGISL
ncbi:hypothetical protein CBL_21464, partial [Carabus blaptoides fortunei]